MSNRRFWRVLLAIALGALVIRVAYVEIAKRDEPMIGDQLFYNAEANRLARGDGFLEPFDPQALKRGEIREGEDPAADHPPLTVLVLAPVSKITDESEVAQRLTMAMLGTAVVVLIGLLARELAGDRAGWIAAGIAAVYPNIWVNDGLVMSETLAALTVTLALLFAYRLVRAPTLRWAVLVGVCSGLSALARAELLLLVPLLAVPAALVARTVAARVRWKLAAVALAAAAVVVAPWVLYNLSRFEEPTFLSTNDGIALLGSNCDSVYFGHGIGLTDLRCLHDNPPGDESVDSKIYRRRAFTFIKHHRTRFVVVAAARVGRTWSLYRPQDMISYNEGEGRESWVTTLGLITYYPVLALAVVGVVVLRRRRARLWLLLIPPLVVTVASAATYGQTRFRAPAEPSLAVLAAIALAAILTREWPSRRRRGTRAWPRNEGHVREPSTIEASSSS